MKKITFLLCLAIGSSAFAQGQKMARSSTEFIPAGFVVVQKIQADLNKDQQPDDILIIKDTKKSSIVDGVDRNRRGIVIAFKRKDQYELALENRACFESENEDGGVYFPPELSVKTQKGNLLIHYAHGRYGYWSYTFRYQNADFELIGYDSSQNRGSVVDESTSINLLTKKMRIRENLNRDAERDGDEQFKETWKNLTIPKPFRLKDIANFEDFELETIGRLQQGR